MDHDVQDAMIQAHEDAMIKLLVGHHRLHTNMTYRNGICCPIEIAIYRPLVQSSGLMESELIHSSDEMFDKIIRVFSELCNRGRILVNRGNTHFIPSLLSFGTQGNIDVEKFGSTLVFFKQLANFSLECNLVILNTIRQIHALYSLDQELYESSFRNVHFVPVWETVQNLLYTLVTLDNIVTTTCSIGSSWKEYTTMVSKLVQESESNEESPVSSSMDVMLLELDSVVFRGKFFSTCCEQNFENENGSIDSAFLTSFQEYLKIATKDLTMEWNLANRELDLSASFECEHKYVGLTALLMLHTHISRKLDVGLFQNLWKFQTSAPMVVLHDKISWTFAEFVAPFVPLDSLLTPNLTPKDPTALRKQYLEEYMDSVPERIRRYVSQVTLWTCSFQDLLEQSAVDGGKITHETIAAPRIIELLREGLSLATRIRRVMLMTLNLCRREQTTLSKKFVKNELVVCMNLLKGLRRICTRYAIPIWKSFPMLFKTDQIEMLNIVQRWHERLQTNLMNPKKMKRNHEEKKIAYRNMDAALCILESIISSTSVYSCDRLTTLRLALAMVESRGVTFDICKSDELVQVEQSIQLMDSLKQWDVSMDHLCNMSVLYWDADTFLPTILEHVFQNSSLTFQMRSIIDSFMDALKYVRAYANIQSEREDVVRTFCQWIIDTIAVQITKPLCMEIDSLLRLQQHTTNITFVQNTQSAPSSKRRIDDFLKMAPIWIGDASVHIKHQIETMLEKQFYEMTLLEPGDWQVYNEMRKIAREKYRLDIRESGLPHGMQDTGLDVLQIMRNISVFVSLYNYNLNQQVFIEKKPQSGAKHLKTISTTSISNSMATHGLGIMNTCVNYTYQYLVKSFEIFSEFLYDENIKSHLAKEIRWFATNASDVQHMYPFARAYHYNKEIRRLGEPSPGISYLGMFRQHITKIGNALGYVRMVRSAGIHCISDAVQYVPDFEHCVSLTGNGDDEASGILHDVLSDLTHKFNEETDYFKVLVDVFHQVLQSSKGVEHLENFYMIIPPLMINYVESVLRAKDQIARARKGKESYFTDDGFAIGIAYLLTILKQNAKFESLRWFMSLKTSFELDRNKLDQETKGGGGTQSDKKASTERLDVYRREYELVRFALAGSQIFFS